MTNDPINGSSREDQGWIADIPNCLIAPACDDSPMRALTQVVAAMETWLPNRGSAAFISLSHRVGPRERLEPPTLFTKLDGGGW
jgi:hypothetical protein